MPDDSQEHHRRSIRLPAYDYSGPGAYFITIVTQARVCLFGLIDKGEMQLSGRGTIADYCWRCIPDHFDHVELGAYVVMPNHVHGILILHDREDDRMDGAAIISPPVGATQWVAPTTGGGTPTRPNGPKRGSIGAIIGAYKMVVTRKIVQQFGGEPHIWQRNYHEHVIRDDTDHRRIHLYLETNIVNWADDEENSIK